MKPTATIEIELRRDPRLPASFAWDAIAGNYGTGPTSSPWAAIARAVQGWDGRGRQLDIRSRVKRDAWLKRTAKEPFRRLVWVGPNTSIDDVYVWLRDARDEVARLKARLAEVLLRDV